MPTTFHVRALASPLRIELDDSVAPADQAAILAQWNDLITEDDAAMTIRATIGEATENGTAGQTLVSAPSAEELADTLTSTATLLGIGGLSGEALMLHASAIALDDGRVIGFVGPSGRGKTTAAKALAHTFGYITDETLAIRPDGEVISYPKPLSIGTRPQHKTPMAASALGLRIPAASDDLRLAALVLLDRRKGIDRPRVEPVTLIEALGELVPQTSYLSQMTGALANLVRLIRSTGGVRRVVYSEADTLPSIVDEILATTHDDVESVTDVSRESQQGCGCGAGSSDEVASGAPGTYRRTAHTNAVLVDDRLIVLRTDQVTVLEGVGPIVWLAAQDSTDAELLEAVLEQLPAPPPGVDPAGVVADAVSELLDAKLLIRS
jgi:energy-coupling factor transporter ATP-binding protein EcfA2